MLGFWVNVPLRFTIEPLLTGYHFAYIFLFCASITLFDTFVVNFGPVASCWLSEEQYSFVYVATSGFYKSLFAQLCITAMSLVDATRYFDEVSVNPQLCSIIRVVHITISELKLLTWNAILLYNKFYFDSQWHCLVLNKKWESIVDLEFNFL